MWKAYYRRQPARLFASRCSRRSTRRPGSRGRGTIGGQPAPDAGGCRVRACDRRLRAVRPGHRPGVPAARPARACRRRGRRPARAALVGRPPGARAGRRYRRGRHDHRPVRHDLRRPAGAVAEAGGCAAWPPRSATAVRPTIRMARRVRAAPTGRRSPDCCGTRIEACTRVWPTVGSDRHGRWAGFRRRPSPRLGRWRGSHTFLRRGRRRVRKHHQG